MTYLPYLMMAYGVFVLVMLWDFIVPRLQLRSALRDARRHATRSQRRQASPDATQELSR